MSNFQGHFRYSALTSIVSSIGYGGYLHLTGQQITPDNIGLFAGICLSGGLFPDLDTHSKPSMILSLILAIYGAISIYQHSPYPALLILTIYAFIKSFPHRNYIHSYWVPSILLTVWLLMGNEYVLAGFIGVMCHFLADKIYPNQYSSWVKPFPWSIKI